MSSTALELLTVLLSQCALESRLKDANTLVDLLVGNDERYEYAQHIALQSGGWKDGAVV